MMRTQKWMTIFMVIALVMLDDRFCLCRGTREKSTSTRPRWRSWYNWTVSVPAMQKK